MKDFLEQLHKWGIQPIVSAAGTATLVLIGLCFVPSLNYIPKTILLYILTPFVLGSR